MRIEILYLQEPVILIAVPLEELLGKREDLSLGMIIRSMCILPVHPVLSLIRSFRVLWVNSIPTRGFCRVLNLSLPCVAFLTANQLVTGVPVVIRRTAVFPVMVVVGNKVGIDSPLVKHFRYRVIKGLQRPPAAVEKVVAAGMQVSPGRHARHAADKRVVEGNGLFGQAGEVWSVDIPCSVRR
jgi:hypothetical protein